MTFFVLGGVACNGCHEEPTIIIRFEPTDADVKPSSPFSPASRGGAPSPTPTPSPKPEVIKAAKSKKGECKADADCVVVPEDCCDCANGGRQQSIPKSRVAAAKADRVARCKHTMCTMMFSTDPTCGMRAQCVAGQCALTKKN